MTITAIFMERFPELGRLLDESEFLRDVARERARKRSGVPLSAELIRLLEGNRCWAEDWSRVRAPAGLRPSRIFDVKFFGDVELGAFTADEADAGDGVALPAGVYNSTLRDCTVGDDCLVYNTGLMSRVTMGTGAAAVNTKVISCRPGGTEFGNGRDVALGIEIGGREVAWFAEISLSLAEAVARNRGDKEFQEAYREFVRAYAGAARCGRTLIGEGARIAGAGRIVDSYIGPWAAVENAAAVETSTVLSCREEPARILDAAYVNASCVQWGCRIASASQVDRSVMCEASGTDRQGRVLHSIIGSNTNVAGGEVTASLVGPFVGFHHQALLIAAFWPEGRGNVAYGANVGSNHTSKLPDQEIWPGAGVFFGLGVNVKYPSDFSRAPWSIFATGVSTLPQRIEFPFSLVNAPAERMEGVCPAFNEILPAWVLSDQIYAVLRNEQKFRQRDRALRTRIDFETFTPETVDLMIEARRRLTDIPEAKSVYTEADVAGLGKNYMTEKSRLRAVETYTFYICAYALRGLKRCLEKRLAAQPPSAVERMLGERSREPRWEHERTILAAEHPRQSVAELLERLVRCQERIARDVQLSKEKDDIRGRRIIPDYDDAHRPATADPFIVETCERTSALAGDVETLLSRIRAMQH